ncbi:protein of unknown function [Microbacterium sp. Nx66]|nr:protein of unknown function [Microbacterium sp. Nx66]
MPVGCARGAELIPHAKWDAGAEWDAGQASAGSGTCLRGARETRN